MTINLLATVSFIYAQVIWMPGYDLVIPVDVTYKVPYERTADTLIIL